jgi:hypothetical protein
MEYNINDFLKKGNRGLEKFIGRASPLISLAIPEANGCRRAIPVDFHHCPCAAKPSKNADAFTENNCPRPKQFVRMLRSRRAK